MMETPMIAYNLFYRCHYKDYENDPNYQSLKETEEYKSFSRQEKYYLEKKIYQDDLLSIFHIETEKEFKDDVVNALIHQLFLLLEKHEDMRSLMKKLGGDDLEMGLMILFSMDYLYLAHPCFCEFLEKGTIDPEKLERLKKELRENGI